MGVVKRLTKSMGWVFPAGYKVSEINVELQFSDRSKDVDYSDNYLIDYIKGVGALFDRNFRATHFANTLVQLHVNYKPVFDGKKKQN